MEPTTSTQRQEGDAPNSPDLKAGEGAHTPALTSIGQAVALVKGLQSEARDRNIKNARIQEKYNAERPYDPGRLASDGLSWKANFTTKPLGTLIDKVVPRFTTAVRNMRYLTASALPERYPDAAKKTELFRTEVTKTVRQHEDWDELMSNVAQENALFGFAALGWLDTTSWFPSFYRQDHFLVPQGTKHTARSAQVVALKESYLIHQMFDLISNRDAAKIAGWDVNNVVEAINSATPDDRRSQQSDPERMYADLSRESNVINSFFGAKTVEVWHVLIAEVDGFITHVAFDAKSDKQLFWKSKQFPSMSDAAAFFSFQHGNGKLQGSKGIGRELYNMAGILDKSRNEVVDRLQLSGKLVLTCEERDIKRFRMSVVGNAILIASGYAVQQQKIDGGVEPFFALDRFLTEILDQVAGSTSPKLQEGERVTKAAVELNAAREEERRDAVIERFLTQFARLMSTIQRRLCSEGAIDSAAKNLQEVLLKHMTREELNYLSQQPAVAAIQDYSENERQRIIMVAQEARGNPLYNQYELERRSLEAKVSPDFAKGVLLAQNDPTESNENARQQKMEMLLLEEGQECEVSPRDNHLVHLQILQEVGAPLIQQAVDNPTAVPLLHSLAAHATQHLLMVEQAGMKEESAPYRQWLQELGKALQKLEQVEAEHAAEMQQLAAETVPGSLEAQQMAQTPGAPAVSPVAANGEQEQPVNTQRASNNERITISYKDAPPSIRKQMEIAAGFVPHTETEDELIALGSYKPPVEPKPAKK